MTGESKPRHQDRKTFRAIGDEWAAEAGKATRDALTVLIELHFDSRLHCRVPSKLADYCCNVEYYSAALGRKPIRTAPPDLRHRPLDTLSQKVYVNTIYSSTILNIDEKTALRPLALPFSYNEYCRIERTDEIFIVSDIELRRSDFLRCCRWLEDHQWTWPDRDVVIPPSFWGDPWAGQPFDWLEGVPGFESSKNGLSLKDALERFSDPGTWADYEAASYSISDQHDAKPAERLLDELKGRFVRNVCAGRLFVTGYADSEPHPTSETLSETLVRDLTFDFASSTASLGSKTWVGLRIFRPEDVPTIQLSTNDYASRSGNTENDTTKAPIRSPGRPTSKKWFLDKFAERAEQNIVGSTLKEEAQSLQDLAHEQIPHDSIPAVFTIENHIRSAYKIYQSQNPRN